jgi:hypothetical protein
MRSNGPTLLIYRVRIHASSSAHKKLAQPIMAKKLNNYASPHKKKKKKKKYNTK